MNKVGNSWNILGGSRGRAGQSSALAIKAGINQPVRCPVEETWRAGGREGGPKRQHVHRSKWSLFPVCWSPGAVGSEWSPSRRVHSQFQSRLWSTGSLSSVPHAISSFPHIPFRSVADGPLGCVVYWCVRIILRTQADSTLLHLKAV